MKKIIPLLTLFLFTMLAFSSCEREQWGDKKVSEEEDNRAEGQISLSGFQVSIDESVSTVTRSIGTNDFIIRIYDIDKEGKMVQEWKYSEMPEIFALKVSNYSITAMSHEVQPAEFEKPYYFAKQDFKITENTVTNLQELVCSLNNIKVKIAYDDNLKALLGEDTKVGVSIGEGRLEYTKDETRAGYFKSIGETNILITDLSATVQGEKVTMSKAFIDVQPGEERIVKYTLKEGSGSGSGSDTGETGKLNIQIDVTCEIVEKDIVIDPGEEEPLPDPDPEDPDNPDNPDTTNMPTIVGDGFDITKSITIPPGTSVDNPYPVVVNIAAQEGIKNLEIGITSSSTDFSGAIADLKLTNFDLANPGTLTAILTNLGLPYGDAVLDQTEINFDISGFTGLMMGFPGTHRFSLKVTDSKGNSTSAVLTLIIN